jgi:hypothetical protein
MNTENWRIRKAGNEEDSFFFIEADLKDAEKNGHYPRVEIMQEDFGDHNGYTHAIRMEDAELIVLAPKMKEAITEVLEVLDGNGVPNIEWVKNRLLEAVK